MLSVELVGFADVELFNEELIKWMALV